ncbi:MAG TPA: hypothetical protein VFH02_10175 [Jiangellaceae bacterium]|jgi:hypothetical protein|nr:hypothetical protein [Jiangellaceae bacterium]
MAAPEVLFDLALTLHPEHGASAQERAAILAGRLGYREVWLPVGDGYGWPDPGRLETLAGAAGSSRVGLVVTGVAAEVAAALRSGRARGALLELESASDDLVDAVGGATAWRERVRLPHFDPAAAGTVVVGASRPEVLDGVRAAVGSRSAAGVSRDRHRVVAAVPVSIGRTFSEADARARRDPRLSGDRDPRQGGLFGTHEQAQSQALDLAAAGVDVVRVTVADEVDVADLLAQVRSLVVGATPVLHARRT